MSYAYNTHGGPAIGGALPGLPQRTGGKNQSAAGGLTFSEAAPDPEWEPLDGSEISNRLFDVGVKFYNYDTTLGSLPGLFVASGSDITSAVFSSDGKELLATATGGQFVAMWDNDNGVFTSKTAPSGGSFAHSASAFSPLGNQLAIGYGTTPFVSFYRKNTDGSWSALAAPADLPAAAVSVIAYSPDGTHCAVATTSTVASQKLTIYKISGTTRTKLSGVPTGLGTGAIKSLAYSPDGSELAIGRADGENITILNRDGDSYSVGNPITMTARNVLFLKYSNTGKFLALSSSSAPTVTVWRVGVPAPYVVLEYGSISIGQNAAIIIDFGRDDKTFYFSGGDRLNYLQSFSIFGDVFELMSSASSGIDGSTNRGMGVASIPGVDGTVVVLTSANNNSAETLRPVKLLRPKLQKITGEYAYIKV